MSVICISSGPVSGAEYQEHGCSRIGPAIESLEIPNMHFGRKRFQTPMKYTSAFEEALYCRQFFFAEYLYANLPLVCYRRDLIAKGLASMKKRESIPAERIFTWQHYGLPDYAPIERRLPLVENSQIQNAPGPFVTGATIVANDDVAAIHTSIKPGSIGLAVLRQGFTGFFVPLRWAGELRINGVEARPGAIYTAVDDVALHVRGGQREQFACILPRTEFLETVAVLRGMDSAHPALLSNNSALGLAPAASDRIRKDLAALIGNSLRSNLEPLARVSPSDLTTAIFEIAVEAYLNARPEPVRKSGRVRNPGRIVRIAEERFAQAGGAKISMADLCAAAGVSKSALYLAFEQVCGEPPITYFYKRRLTKARSGLLQSDPGRGIVKQTALGLGLTELGRFSRDYRKYFGESPSVTLARSIA